MSRIRLVIRHNADDPVEDLRYAARVRTNLWAHSPVEIDPDSGVHGTHRDSHRNAYFEFRTDMIDEVYRVLDQFGHRDRVKVEIAEDPVGEPCQNCGNIAGPVLPTVCPTCGHRDISACPSCGEDVPRQEYEKISGDLFRCPRCRNRVRLQINPDAWRSDGSLNEPVVLTVIPQA